MNLIQSSGSILLSITLPLSLYSHANTSTEDYFSMTLEELMSVVIDTRKTSESFMESPISMTLVDSETMQTYGLDTLYDVAEIVPSFSFRPSFGKLQERGVTRGTANIVGDNVTGIFLDGKSISGTASALSLKHFQRVEVIKGPQSVLFGRTTFAGAVNLVSSDPLVKSDEFVEVEFNDSGDRRFDLSANQLINQKSAVQLDLSVIERDSDYSNTLGDGDKDINAMQHLFLRAGYSFDHDANRLKINAYHIADDDSGFATILQTADANNCFLNTTRQYYCGELETPDKLGLNNAFLGDRREYQFTSNIVTARWDRKLNDQHQVYVSGLLNTIERDYTQDGDYTTSEVVWVGYTEEADTTDIDTVWNADFGNGFSLNLGLNYYDRSFESSRVTFLVNSTQVADPRITDVRSTALFSRLAYDFTDRLNASIDIRYAEDQIGFKVSSVDGDSEFYTFSPKVTLQFQRSYNEMYYASLSQGHKPGGFNTEIYTTQFNDVVDTSARDDVKEFDSEEVQQVEVGYKALIFDSTLGVLANAFYSNWNDLQTSRSVTFELTDNTTQSESIVANGGKAEIYGFEFELDWHPTEKIAVQLNYSWLTNEIRGAESSAQFDLYGDASIDGQEIPNVPNQTFAVGINHTRNLLGHTFKSHALITYESKRYVAEHNLATIPSITKLRLGGELRSNSVTFSIFAMLADEDGHIESAARLGDPETFFARRAFGLTLSDRNHIGMSVRYRY